MCFITSELTRAAPTSHAAEGSTDACSPRAGLPFEKFRHDRAMKIRFAHSETIVRASHGDWLFRFRTLPRPGILSSKLFRGDLEDSLKKNAGQDGAVHP